MNLAKTERNLRGTNRATAAEQLPMNSQLSSQLVKQIISEFSINPGGHHGVPHWMRVRANGLRLAAETGANPVVVELFAVFHDSQRMNEDTDPEHGKRGALNALRYRQMGAFEVSPAELQLVFRACWGHTYEDIEAPCITVLTCWDADRLDLGRVGIMPDPERLFTTPAKREDTIEWAWQQSMKSVERHW